MQDIFREYEVSDVYQVCSWVLDCTELHLILNRNIVPLIFYFRQKMFSVLTPGTPSVVYVYLMFGIIHKTNNKRET